jgi:hypothetical protein
MNAIKLSLRKKLLQQVTASVCGFLLNSLSLNLDYGESDMQLQSMQWAPRFWS